MITLVTIASWLLIGLTLDLFGAFDHAEASAASREEDDVPQAQSTDLSMLDEDLAATAAPEEVELPDFLATLDQDAAQDDEIGTADAAGILGLVAEGGDAAAGSPAEIGAFDGSEDALVIAYDPATVEDPEVAVVEDEDDQSLIVTLNGQPVANLARGSNIGPNDIFLVATA